MDSTLTSSPLPSLSPLTGTYRSANAQEAIDKAYLDSNRRWLSTAGGTRYQTTEPPSTRAMSNGQGTGASALREAAGRHVSELNKAPGTPYQRVLSSATKAQIKADMAQKLQQFVEQLQAAAARVATPGAAQQGAEAGLGDAAAGPSAAGDLPRPATAASAAAAAANKRPSTALSTTEVVLPRPGSRLERVKAGGLASNSWNGPLTTLGQQQQQQQPPNFHVTPRLGTPASPKARMLGRLSTPQLKPLPPMMFTAGHGGGKAEVWTNSTAIEPSSGGLGTSGRLRDTGRSHHQRPGTSGGSLDSGTVNPATTSMRLGGLGSTGHLAGQAKPSRGVLYSVFQDLDKYGEGRITYSVFEDAALLVGMHTEQSKRFFSMLDKKGQGFITTHEWGSDDYEKQLSDFARLYIQKTRGADGRYKGAQEIDNLYAALQLAIYKLHLKNSGRSVSHERLLQAFSFMDRDNSGLLDRKEVHDAFNGMGIYITNDVLEEAMRTFDKDGSGDIEYAEFIQTLFPTLSKGYRMG